ncbi:MAG: NHL domain-containing protein [Bacteroidia bacterium]
MKRIFTIALVAGTLSANAQIITTVVGTGYGAGTGMGNYSGDGGAATIAEMHGPHGIVFDKQGNLFISEDVNSVIRIVNTSGIINKYAGVPSTTGSFSGNGGSKDTTLFSQTAGMAFDTNGSLYIADAGFNVIRKINTQGIVTTIAGNPYKYGGYSFITGVKGSGYNGDGGLADSAFLNFPSDVAFDNKGNLYIADTYNNLIRKVNTVGLITTVAGDTNGVTNYSCSAVCNAGYSGDGGKATNAKLNNPMGITVDNLGNLYIADENNNLIRKVSTAGIITTIAGDTNGIHSGSNLGYTGNGGQATSAKLGNPSKVCFDSFGNMYIAEIWNNVIRKINTAGIISTVVGTGGSGYTGDNGLATSATMNQPYYIFCDTLNNLYIADWYNNVVRKVTNVGQAGIAQLGVMNNELTIYPNPASTHLTLTLSKGEGTTTVYIYDMLGKLVMQHTYSPPSEGQGEALDVSDLSEGLYLIRLSNSGGVQQQKLVISR